MEMAEFHQIAGYDVVASLGQGAASKLYSVRDKHGQSFCLKRVVKKSASEQRFLDQAIQEYQIAKDLDSPMIRRVYNLIRQRNFLRTSEVLVVMELIEGRTLEEIKFNGMASYAKLMFATARALQCMHQSGYVHADIKPNNIMIDNAGVVKLIDFGQSCKIGTVKERIQGTPDYIAPEQVKRQPITAKTDIFNLGATMYWLITGSHVPTLLPKNTEPGSGMSLRTEPNPKDLATPIQIKPDCPPALSNLIMDCLAKDPVERPEHMQAVIDRAEIAAAQARRAAERQASSTPREGQANDRSGDQPAVVDVSADSSLANKFT